MGGAASKGVFGSRTTAQQVADFGPSLAGKCALVTGANTGIGKETAKALYSRGARVVLACRSQERGDAAIEWIKQRVPGGDGAEVECWTCDLNSLSNVQAFAKRYTNSGRPLHILVNNAGVMAFPKYQETEDHIEKQWGVNYVGHYLLSRLLVPVLIRTARDVPDSPVRVVNVASGAHRYAPNPFNASVVPPTEEGYDAWRNYGISKFSNIFFGAELNRRLQSFNVQSFSLHPGVISTDLGRYDTKIAIFYTLAKPFIKSIPQGAATTLFCAVDSRAEPGAYHLDCHASAPRGDGRQPEQHQALWQKTEELLREKGVELPDIPEPQAKL